MFKPSTLSEKALYSTVRLKSRDRNTNRDGFGTAFILNLNKVRSKIKIPVLITNRHVLENSDECSILLHEEAPNAAVPNGTLLEYTIKNEGWTVHPDHSIDLCCFPFGSIVNDLINNRSKRTYYAAFGIEQIATEDELTSDFSAVNDVLMFGYPIGLSDEFNNLPIVRKGITASHPAMDFNGKTVGAADIACFPGSSGSPLMVAREGWWYSKREKTYKIGGPPILLGVLFGSAKMNAAGVIDISSIPMQNQLLTADRMLALHVGFYIKSAELLKLRAEFGLQEGINLDDDELGSFEAAD